MARPREFDEDNVLTAAMETFWSQGYQGTSLSDLCQAMDLKKGSIYKAFGDKRQLFIAALTKYLDQVETLERNVLESGSSPMQCIEFWLKGSVEFARSGDCKGCLAMNSSLEGSGMDEEIQGLLAVKLKTKIDLLTSIIMQGQKKGQFRSDVAAHNLAMTLQSQVLGLFVMIKGKHGDFDAGPNIETIMALIR